MKSHWKRGQVKCFCTKEESQTTYRINTRFFCSQFSYSFYPFSLGGVLKDWSEGPGASSRGLDSSWQFFLRVKVYSASWALRFLSHIFAPPHILKQNWARKFWPKLKQWALTCFSTPKKEILPKATFKAKKGSFMFFHQNTLYLIHIYG